MGIFRDTKDAPESLDLRRPKIPKAPPLPQIRGPRGGLAYEPHPQDRVPEKPATRKLTGQDPIQPLALSRLALTGLALSGREVPQALPVMPITLAAGVVATVNYLAQF